MKESSRGKDGHSWMGRREVQVAGSSGCDCPASVRNEAKKSRMIHSGLSNGQSISESFSFSLCVVRSWELHVGASMYD